MSDRKAAIRLGTEGKAQVIRDLDEIATAGDAGAKRWKRAYERAGEDVEAAMQRQARAAEKISTFTPSSPVQQRVDALAGPGSAASGKSARDSALAFRELISAQERLEERTRNFLTALDPAYAAQQRFNAEMAEAKSLVGAGAITLDQYCDKLRLEKATLESVTASKQRDNQMTGQARAGYQQLSFQINDVVASAASGGSLFTIFAQQASQFVQALSMISEGGGGGADGGGAKGATGAVEEMKSTLNSANETFDAVTGATERASTALRATTAATNSNSTSATRNTAAREGQVGATAAATKAVTTNTIQVGGNAAATEAATVATSGWAAAKMRLVAFMAGPYGAAVIGGVTILGMMGSKLIETSNAVDKQTEKLKEDAKESLNAAKAKDAYAKSTAGAIADVRALTAELREQNKALSSNAELENIRAKEGLQRLRDAQAADERKLAGVERTPNKANMSDRVNLRKEIADRKALIVEAERAVQATRVPLAVETAERMTDVMKRIDRKYDEQAAAAQRSATARAAAGQTIGVSLAKELAAIERNRDAEIEAENKRREALTETNRVRRDSEAATAASISRMLRGELPGVQVTSTTGGRHVRNSYHYRNQAVDFVPAGGMGSMTKDDVRRIFNSRGIEIIELLGPGDQGHSDHFHVAWAKGRAALDEFADAAKRAEERATELDALTSRYAPATAAAEQYRKTLEDIARLKPENAAELTAAARTEYTKARAGLLGDRLGISGLQEGARVEQEAIDKATEERKRVADYTAGMLGDQREAMVLAQAEFGLLAANDNVRDAALAKVRLITQLTRDKIGLDSEGARQIIANADAYEAVLDQLRRQRAVWDEIRGFGGEFVDTVLSADTWSDWGEGGKRVLDMLKQEFVKLALLNPIRNMLFGEQNATLSGVLGNLGKLFGKTPVAVTAGGSQGFIGPPGAASGTPYTSGGDMLVGEFGPEIARMPRGASVVPAGETRRLLAANDGPAQVSNYYDLRGAVVQERLYDQMRAIGDTAAARGAAGGAQIGYAETKARAGRKLGRRW